MKCSNCNYDTDRLIDGRCTMCFCESAVKDTEAEIEAEMREEMSGVDYASLVNTPITSKDYKDIVLGNRQISWCI